VEPKPEQVVDRPVRKLNPTLIALLGGIVVLLALLWLFAGNRGADQDKLTGNELTQVAAPANPGKLCASPATYDFIKRDLFRRAAQLRGSDQAAYDKLAAYAVVRMENPVLESEDNDTGALNCSGSLSLDLPPGVAIVDGRRTLTADVDYTIQRAADGGGTVILLRNADAIVAPLATLARVASPVAAPDLSNIIAPVEPLANPPAAASPPIAPAQPLPAPQSARPSFDCARASTSGERAVCADSGLAALDRNMAAQYSRSQAAATTPQRVLLQQTRDRFLAFRDRCPNRQCIADAYTGRMREIRDIMEGRWQPPR
jgi:uncharacterized protein YecT (DUF1311 family)